MIELRGVSKHYGKALALSKINLFVQEGEILAIIGKSGAGKSSLLRLMNLLIQPDTGQIIIDNQEITRLPIACLREARHKMGMIFQQFNLLESKTVYDNIALPMRIQQIDETFIQEKVDELLTLIEMKEKVNQFPAQLSGGQKQRVAIARALSCSPKILLCDEATSALDPETTHAVLTLLKKINQRYGITIVVVTHEMNVVKQLCHRLVLMQAGEILETARLTEVINKPQSQACQMLYRHLSPALPPALQDDLSQRPNNKPLMRLYFQGENATAPFISQISRDLALDINILLANIDCFDEMTCGVMVVELEANKEQLERFSQKCAEFNIRVEIIGYVTGHVF
ncbi:MAG: ATP-binding cassette domain-containing protein [Legionella sp.]|nr:ATP-binding cassette domain-containing protein [Legionella sp.]